MLNSDLTKVGNQVNTTINGTSSVDSVFNTQFRTLVFNNNNNNVTSLMNAVVNYVNRFDPKYRAMFVTNATEGVTWVKVQIQKVKGQK
ncbi:hemagglutinin, partial [Mycoplasmopsis synoviae]